MRKKYSIYRYSDLEKLLKFETEGREFAEITRTMYSNCEKSLQFLKQNSFLTFFWGFLKSYRLEQLETSFKNQVL